MKKLLSLILMLLMSCSSSIQKSDFNFSKDLSSDELRLKLIEYAKNNPYPNIDDKNE